MKLTCKLIIILSFYANCIKAQNIVPNSSFETLDSCQFSYSSIYFANPWFQPNKYYGNTTNSSSSDIFNTCCVSSVVGVPANTVGNQMPRTGNGYAGIGCVIDTMNVREYIEVPLDSVLVSRQKYCVEFYVSLGDASSLATSNIGAYFSVDSLLDSTQGNAINSIIPQIANPTSVILSDKTNWMKIFGVFTAQGGEKFMTIGNFLSPANTIVQNVGGSYSYAYYYIDDISVTACDTTLIGINETAKQEDFFKLYPNPNNGNMNLIYSMDALSKGEFIIYDIAGKIIDVYNLQQGENNQLLINETRLSNGIYFYKILINGAMKAGDRLIIIK